MVLKNTGHPFEHDMKNICTLFFPDEKITDSGSADIEIVTEKSGSILKVGARVCNRKIEKSHILTGEENESESMSALLYGALSQLLGYRPPWGILFGVRPAKLMRRLSADMGVDGAKNYFVNNFLVSPQKAELAARVMENERRVISLSDEKSFSLYVSIPFCPTRCAYCSFVSHSIQSAQKLLQPYTQLLCRELDEIGRIAQELGLRLETVYFGGGTPTTLGAYQLSMLFNAVEGAFDLSHLREYTVEAGRPDTVTPEKLSVLKNAGVTRISINPQSFNSRVLEKIGRRHTPSQTIDAFELARRAGFKNINMDLIAGLPGDDLQSFINSTDKAISLGAESVTVHTLAVKTAADIAADGNAFDTADRKAASDMVKYSGNALADAGYYPYYMYRQSKSVGNLENVGWCRDGYDCLYNVYMMDETHSVFAAGAGAVTRLKNQKSGYIERIYNYKYPYEYIDGFDKILERKYGIEDFYNLSS